MSTKYGVVLSAHWEGDLKPQVDVGYYKELTDEQKYEFVQSVCDFYNIYPVGEKLKWTCSTCGWKGTKPVHDCKDSVLKLWADSEACKDLKDR